MRYGERLLACCAVAALIGCGDYAGGKQVTAARDESGEEPNFGSATDIVSEETKGMSTNDANYADHPVGRSAPFSSGYRSQPRPTQDSDAELAKQIKVALTTGSLGTTGAIAEDQLTTIEVSVQDGVVTLRGPVVNEAEKENIEKQVEQMKGVHAVRNELTPGARPAERNPIDAVIPRAPGNE